MILIVKVNPESNLLKPYSPPKTFIQNKIVPVIQPYYLIDSIIQKLYSPSKNLLTKQNRTNNPTLLPYL